MSGGMSDGNVLNGEKFAKVLATYCGNIKAVGKNWDDATLEVTKGKLLGWRQQIDDVLAFVNVTLTERQKERAKRYRLAATYIRLVEDCEGELAEVLRKKHKLTDQEIEEVRTKKHAAATTRRSGDADGKHVIIQEGRVVYKNKRSAYELFRSFAKKHAPQYVGANDTFNYELFLNNVCETRKADLRSGHTWTYAGKRWTYEVRAE